MAFNPMDLNNDGRVIISTSSQGEPDELLADRVRMCLESSLEQISLDGQYRVLPLTVILDDKEHSVGAVGFRIEQEPEESWNIVKGMIAGYLATALYSYVVRFESGFRDIEQIREESQRLTSPLCEMPFSASVSIRYLSSTRSADT